MPGAGKAFGNREVVVAESAEFRSRMHAVASILDYAATPDSTLAAQD